MTNFVKTTMRVAIHREDVSPVFGEGVTYVSIEDEGGGPFLVLEQDDSEFHKDGMNHLRLDYAEFVEVAKAANALMHQMYIEKADLESMEIKL